MLDFMGEGQWLAVVPVLLVAEYLTMTIGLMIFASCRNLIALPQSGKLHDRPNAVPDVVIVLAYPGFRRAHGVGLAGLKSLKAIARCLFPLVAIGLSSCLA